MLSVKNLTKNIDGKPIVEEISFDLEDGEILGFVGPNGAGKTTTLRMLACCTAPNSGTAALNGLDLVNDDLEIRKRIGYLPEVPPLYEYMKVRTYLTTIARLKGIPKNKQIMEVDRTIERCYIGDMAKREIGKLSKGYRQRVGLAQAILGDPELLLLDEPTSSLDPGQISEMRDIIREASGKSMVIFSTHILQEIQHLCDRIVLIKNGKVRYQGRLDRYNLTDDGRRSLMLKLKGKTQTIESVLSTRSSDLNFEIKPAKNGEPVKVSLHFPDSDDTQSEILKELLHANIRVLEVTPLAKDLEQTILQFMRSE